MISLYGPEGLGFRIYFLGLRVNYSKLESPLRAQSSVGVSEVEGSDFA